MSFKDFVLPTADIPDKLMCLYPDDLKEKLLKDLPKDEKPIWDLWEDFLSNRLSKGYKETTLLAVRNSLRYIARQTEVCTVESLNDVKTFTKILEYLKSETGILGGTANDYKKNVNTFFIWLESQEIIDVNKIRKVEKYQEDHREQYVYTEEQVKLIKYQMVHRRQNRLCRWRNNLFISLISLTGARLCEILKLNHSDMRKDEKGNYQVVITSAKQKGKKRYYDVPSSVRDMYEMYLKILKEFKRDDEDWLLVSSKRKKQWTDKGVRGLFKNLSKELSMPVTAHAFRRFVATHLDSKDLAKERIADYLGHERIATTKTYIKRSTKLTNEGSKILTDLLF